MITPYVARFRVASEARAVLIYSAEVTCRVNGEYCHVYHFCIVHEYGRHFLASARSSTVHKMDSKINTDHHARSRELLLK